MFCPNCGKQLNDNARFCTECGYQIKSVQSNTSVQPEKNVQPDPGMQQEQQVRPAPPAAEVPSSLAGMNNKKKTVFIALIVAAAVIILAFLGIKLFILDKNPAESADTKPKAAADKASDDTARAGAYLEVISDLQQKYGVGSYTQQGEPSGLVIVREIDFDKDGTPELLCAFANVNVNAEGEGSWTLASPYCDEKNCSICYEVWRWQNGQAIRLAHAPMLASYGVDEYVITLSEQDGKIYMLQAAGSSSDRLDLAATVQDRQWVEAVHLYCIDYSGDPFDSDGNFTTSGFTYYNQGEEISEEEYDAISDQFFRYEEDEVKTIPVWYGNAQFQQTVQTIQSLENKSGETLSEKRENSAGTAVAESAASEQPTNTNSRFTDVPETTWYYDAAVRVVDAGFIPIESEDCFVPDHKITNAEFAQVLANISVDDVSDQYPDFADTSADAWYAPFAVAYGAYFPVHWDRHEGAALFLPDVPIDRGELAYTLLRCMGLSENDILDAYEDVSGLTIDKGWKYYPEYALDVMVYMGLFADHGDSEESAYEEVTRAECAVILSNMMDAGGYED